MRDTESETMLLNVIGEGLLLFQRKGREREERERERKGELFLYQPFRAWAYLRESFTD